MKTKYFNECMLKPQDAPELIQTVIPETDIVSYEVREKVIKTGDGEFDVITKPVVVEVSRINRKDYINSFKNDAGIINVLKKVQLTGDTSYLNATKGVFMDLSELPGSVAEAEKIINQGKLDATASGISFDNDALNKYIEDLVKKAVADKGGSVNE